MAILDPREVSARRLAGRVIVDLERADLPAAASTIDTAGSINAADRLLELAVARLALRRLPLSSAARAAAGGGNLRPTRWSAIKSGVRQASGSSRA